MKLLVFLIPFSGVGKVDFILLFEVKFILILLIKLIHYCIEQHAKSNLSSNYDQNP